MKWKEDESAEMRKLAVAPPADEIEIIYRYSIGTYPVI